MKKFKFIILLLMISSTMYGQNTVDTVYYNSDWKITSKDSSSFYRILIPSSNNLTICEDYWISGEIQMKGRYSSIEDETKEGIYTWYYKNGNIKSKVEYKNNKIVSLTKEFDENGQLLIEYVKDLKILDNYSEFDSSNRDFMKFLEKKIHYPKQAKKSGQQGRVFLNFLIDENGNVYNTKILRGVSDDIDKEAIRVVELFKWPKPIYKGEEVIVSYNAPIKFTLH